jgi:hypothetical protein
MTPYILNTSLLKKFGNNLPDYTLSQNTIIFSHCNESSKSHTHIISSLYFDN